MYASAVERVLSTFELLDQIAGHLDWRTAIRVQRVSSIWLDVITNGPSVQHQLGLKALERRRYWVLSRDSLGRFSHARQISQNDHGHADSQELVVVQGRATLLFQSISISAVGGMWNALFGTEYMFKLQDLPQFMLIDDPQASWQGMQITQPPTNVLDMSTSFYFRDALMYRRIAGRWPSTRLENPQGITLGEVLGMVRRWKNEASGDEVDWTNERFAITTIHMVDDDAFFQRLSRAPPEPR